MSKFNVKSGYHPLVKTFVTLSLNCHSFHLPPPPWTILGVRIQYFIHFTQVMYFNTAQGCGGDSGKVLEC